MRTLVLMRGISGCGKSTWLEEHNFSQYVLSADNIRLMISAPEVNIDGSMGISQKKNTYVWSLLYTLLEKRMQNGEFTIIDATNIKRADMNKYKHLAKQYRYRIYCIDMTDVPLETCKQRNAVRQFYKRVHEEVIDRQYAELQNQSVPSGIEVIKPDEYYKLYLWPHDYSKYNAVHIFGDIHGCFEPLNKYLGGEIKNDELYIFCGDYLDRGIQNVEVLQFLMSIMDKKNVILLEGNHEMHLWNWANNKPVNSQAFNAETQYQLENAKINKKDVRRFCRHLSQCAYFKYNENYFVVTHGGINQVPSSFVPARQLIHGIGSYPDSDTIDEVFYNSLPNNYYSIHGHRNVTDAPIRVNDRVFNLENSVECGGNLRIVRLSGQNQIETIEIKNNTYDQQAITLLHAATETNSVEQTVSAMRSTKLVKEKQFGNISSFNFTSKAFRNSDWTDETIKARGLFINTQTNKAVARGYEKFFKINERHETEINNLKETLKFPLTAYVKENGFLGILGYDEEKDELFTASKSTPVGPYADMFRDLLFSSLSAEKLNELKTYLKNNNKSMVFEVIDAKNDPHIIKYDKNKVVLLDIIDREVRFSKLSYDDLRRVGADFGFQVKEKAVTLTTWEEFENWLNDASSMNYLYKNNHIEGFVVEDSNNFLFKIKTYYYDFWKQMRNVSKVVLTHGRYARESTLINDTAKEFYKWLQTKYGIISSDTDIITLREMFYNEN